MFFVSIINTVKFKTLEDLINSSDFIAFEYRELRDILMLIAWKVLSLKDYADVFNDSVLCEIQKLCNLNPSSTRACYIIILHSLQK